KSNSLFDWSLPNLPEDLCFFKDDEAYLSVSSELEEIYIYPTSHDEVREIKEIDGLKTVVVSFYIKLSLRFNLRGSHYIESILPTCFFNTRDLTLVSKFSEFNT